MDEVKYNERKARGEHRLSHRAMQAALLISLYQDEPILQPANALLQLLLDIDQLLTQWRNRHALMVHRMLGIKIGTGGSSGYHYLRATASQHRIFGDLFNIATFLVPVRPRGARARQRASLRLFVGVLPGLTLRLPFPPPYARLLCLLERAARCAAAAAG